DDVCREGTGGHREPRGRTEGRADRSEGDGHRPDGSAGRGDVPHEEVDDELVPYWSQDWLLISLGIGWQTSDGLFLSCRPGRDFGRVGQYFDETGSSFTPWPSLRHLLADYADALECGRPFDGRVPVAAGGVLVWEEERTTLPAPVSPLALAAAAAEPDIAVETVQDNADGPDRVQGQAPAGHVFGWYATITADSSEPAAEAPYAHPDTVFVAGITPAELLRRLGAIPDTVRARTRRQARESGAALWAAARPLVRAGSIDGWAYATQEAGAAQFGRPEVLRRLSQGTRAVSLTTEPPDVRVTVHQDGVPQPQDFRHIAAPSDEDCTVGPAAGRTHRFGAEVRPGTADAYLRLLTGLEEDFEIVHAPDRDTDEELTSALLLPLLEGIDEERWQPAHFERDFDLAELIERTPPDQLRAAVAAQLVRLAVESRIDIHDEIRDALDRIVRGEEADLTVDGELDVRIRTVEAETWAARHLLETARWDSEGAVTEADVEAWEARLAATAHCVPSSGRSCPPRPRWSWPGGCPHTGALNSTPT
ncbi:hypothetical protein ABT112_17730, partial [Streptomyces sp. NPDC002055]|uniref:hypothetical protein n=1 Tax=Streptomyces sp. NPDC002055 TaxID=3154534 RepID=UPI0033207B47